MTTSSLNYQSHNRKLQEESLPPSLKYSCFYTPKYNISLLCHIPSQGSVLADGPTAPHVFFGVSSSLDMAQLYMGPIKMCCLLSFRLIMGPESFCPGDLSFISAISSDFDLTTEVDLWQPPGLHQKHVHSLMNFHLILESAAVSYLSQWCLIGFLPSQPCVRSYL